MKSPVRKATHDIWKIIFYISWFPKRIHRQYHYICLHDMLSCLYFGHILIIFWLAVVSFLMVSTLIPAQCSLTELRWISLVFCNILELCFRVACTIFCFLSSENRDGQRRGEKKKNHSHD